MICCVTSTELHNSTRFRYGVNYFHFVTIFVCTGLPLDFMALAALLAFNGPYCVHWAQNRNGTSRIGPETLTNSPLELYRLIVAEVSTQPHISLQDGQTLNCLLTNHPLDACSRPAHRHPVLASNCAVATSLAAPATDAPLAECSHEARTPSPPSPPRLQMLLGRSMCEFSLVAQS